MFNTLQRSGLSVAESGVWTLFQASSFELSSTAKNVNQPKEMSNKLTIASVSAVQYVHADLFVGT